MLTAVIASLMVAGCIAAAVVDMVREARGDKALARSRADHPAGRGRDGDPFLG